MHSFITGVDEAGRGPLAGPVVAAAVALESGRPIDGVRDSKKLSARRREQLAGFIHQQAAGWAVASASVDEIDRLNILVATLLAMRRAVASLGCRIDLVRIDGNRKPDFSGVYSGPVETLVGGDDLCPAIGAASILAKVARDAMMDELHAQHPEYGFNSHRGYPTAAHRQALFEFGPIAAHRKSFRPVREALLHTRQAMAKAG